MRPLYISGNRAQTELLGFVVVIMLIAVGMLFVIGFHVLSPEADSRTTYLHKQLATNMNDVLLETTTTCRGLTVRELLLACADGDLRNMCPQSDTMAGPEAITACEYAGMFTAARLDETLDAWGYDYEYSIRYDTTTSQNFVVPKVTNLANRAGCKVQRSPLILPGAMRPLIIYLDIFSCRSR